MRKNRKIIMAMAIVLAIATAIAGATFAWFTSYAGVLNHMETGQLTDDDLQIVEIFPVPDINPGVKLDKVVWVVNSGNVDALVRMSFAETLEMLDFDGAAQKVDNVWAGPASTTNPVIPQLFSSSLIEDDGAYGINNGWLDAEAAGSPFTLTSPLPPGAKVLYKEFIVDEGGPNEMTTYIFVIYGEIDDNAIVAGPNFDRYNRYNGALQLATAKFEVDSTDPADLQLTVSDVLFSQFVYLEKKEFKWADLDQFIDLAGFVDATPQYSDFESFTPAMLPSISDPGGFFELYFGTKVFDDLDDCADGKSWWYNENDGYFYYIGKLAPGQATANLLESVMLNEDAGDAYCNLLYQLIVKMEAIQNIEAALLATDGWDLGTGSWVDDLIDALKLVDAFAFS